MSIIYSVVRGQIKNKQETVVGVQSVKNTRIHSLNVVLISSRTLSISTVRYLALSVMSN